MGNFLFRSRVKALVRRCLQGGQLAEWCNRDDIEDVDTLHTALRQQGVEACNLIVGIDFTNSNREQGATTFHGQCLHTLGSPYGPNPYEQCLDLLGRALHIVDGGPTSRVPAYVFGDNTTKHRSVRSLRGVECLGMNQVLDAYREAVKNAVFWGPTSFAPLIREAVKIVELSAKETGAAELHVLLILADGQVQDTENCLADTYAAIQDASKHPLSIVMVGIGDGPWNTMRDFDDGLPAREFDNFQFVPFGEFQQEIANAGGDRTRTKVLETAFALCALQELPSQVKAMRNLRMLGGSASSSSKRKAEEEDGEHGSKRARVTG
mmetsp:Transcript_64302/g.119508  ORF Transcript_64302/g.119508 Transcript_64302/m.119508 type:complete len:322 (+) Transcript_64302:60-1025(+)